MKSKVSLNTMFPIFLKLSKLNVLIVGGGNVAAEKLHFLLKSSPDANITIVAPKFNESIKKIAKKHSIISLLNVNYSPQFIERKDIVIAATNNKEINEKIWRDTKAMNVLVNVADTPDLCDFYMGSIITKGDLKIAISTNGKSPTLARRFREMLEELIPDNLPETLNNLNAIRKNLKGNFTEKVKQLNKITSTMVVKSVKQKQITKTIIKTIDN